MAKKSMLSGSDDVSFVVFSAVLDALEQPHARQAVISIIDKIFFITKSPQAVIGQKISTKLVVIDTAGKCW